MLELSVVIPNHGQGDLLSACLAALERARASHPEAAFEVLVVDNGSRDDSVSRAHRSALGVRVIELGRNRGFAAAVNRGLAARRGRHVLLLNSDAEIAPDLIARGLARLAADPSIGILGPALFHPDGRLQRSAHGYPDWTSEVLPDGLLRGLRRRFASAPPAEEDVEALRGAALFLSGALVDRLGPLDEGYFFFLEETDYCWRAREAGMRIVVDPALRVVHHLGASSKAVAPFATRVEYERSLVRFLESRRGRLRMKLAVTLRLARWLLALVLFSLPGLVVPRIRRRGRERAGMILWHLRGRPAEPSLATALAAIEPGAAGSAGEEREA